MMAVECCGGVTDFVMGFTHAFNQDVSPIPGTSLVRSDGGRNYSNGAGLGHRAALIVGVLEVGAGIGGDAAAVVGEAVSFGAATPAAIPLAIGSTGLILHGGSTISKSLDNMKSEGGTKQRNKPKEDGTPSTSEIQSKDKSGKTDKYTTYDSNGKIEKEYRGSGKDHGNIPRPNVKEPIYNTNPKTGEKFKNGYEVRKAKIEEIPK